MLYNGKSLKWNGIGEREAFVLIWSFGAKVTFVAGFEEFYLMVQNGPHTVKDSNRLSPSLCVLLFL